MEGTRLDPVRDLVLKTFREFGAGDAQLREMTDTLLIRDGRYHGRSFRTDKLMAMWLGGIVQFYSSEGDMLKTVLLTREPESRSKAA